MLRGDEVGALLGEYLARTAKDKSATLANSIVSSSILSKIAKAYQLPFAETLTGFKWIAKIENLHFGYEEALVMQLIQIQSMIRMESAQP